MNFAIPIVLYVCIDYDERIYGKIDQKSLGYGLTEDFQPWAKIRIFVKGEWWNPTCDIHASILPKIDQCDGKLVHREYCTNRLQFVNEDIPKYSVNVRDLSFCGRKPGKIEVGLARSDKTDQHLRTLIRHGVITLIGLRLDSPSTAIPRSDSELYSDCGGGTRGKSLNESIRDSEVVKIRFQCMETYKVMTDRIIGLYVLLFALAITVPFFFVANMTMRRDHMWYWIEFTRPTNNWRNYD